MKTKLCMWLPRITYFTFALWILAQIVVIILFWGAPQGSDQGEYMKLAQRCFDRGEWYPMAEDVYAASSIWAPGLINYFILQFKLFGTLNLNMVLNLLMNVGIAAEIFFLGKKFFTERTAMIAVILWCLLYSNLMIVAPSGTEIPFLFIALSGFCLTLRPKIDLMVLAGVLFAVANWIRPLVIIFLLMSLVYMLVKKYSWKQFASLLVSLGIVIIIIGKATEAKIGYFVYQSVTSGVNLIMTANDRAYGGVATSLLSDSTSTAYIKDCEKLTFAERDSIWKARGVDWIREHPVRYAYLFVKKLGGLYVEDSWADRPILGGYGFVDSYAVAGNVSHRAFINKAVQMGLKSLVYYGILILCCYSIVVHRHEWLTYKSILLLLLLAGTFSTCLFSVSPHYHYPFMFVIVLFAAYGVEYILNKKTNYEKNND